MEAEHKGLLERAKEVVTGAAEGLAGGVQEVLQKLEKLAPESVAGPIQAAAEVAGSFRTHSNIVPATVTKDLPNKQPPMTAAAALPHKTETPSMPLPAAPRKFKVKRGQKH